MLRPERMSKVSVTGSTSVMDDVIETVHDLNLVHLSDYDGSWAGFDNGDPLPGSEEASEKLVTIRSLQNTLGIDEDSDVEPESIDESGLEERLEDVRRRVTELDDRHADLRDERREVADRIDRLEPFATLGIEFEYLTDYDSIDVAVGEGDEDELAAALAAADEVRAFETVAAEDVVALFVAPVEGADDPVGDALVGVEFSRVEIPDAEGSPDDEITDLRRREKQLASDVESVESELEATKHEVGGFLVAAERLLSVQVDRTEAPLRFATSERSFIAEGWIPTREFDRLESALSSAVDDRVEIEELERAEYDDHGAGHAADVHDDGDEPHTGTPGDPTGEVVTDGGAVTMDDEPPVIQRNSSIVNPFEILVRAVNQPRYSELDPTIVLFLTFPLFFGFMIGDIGYGAVYMLIGWWMYRSIDTESVANLGAVIVWMGMWTVAFGLLYGEVFGLHFLEWFDVHAPLAKGIADTDWALSWLIIAVIAGWIHLNVGYVLEFFEELQLHGLKPAIVEVGSWMLMLNGLWVFIFSEFLAGSKPDFFVGPEALLNEGPLGIGFTGFPEVVGMIGAGVFILGIVVLLTGPWYDIFEFVVPLSHTLSYTRLTAVLLAKAGMALAANLLYWGAYQDEAGFHFIHTSTPAHKIEEGKDIVFGGLSNMGTEVALGPLTLGIEGALLGLPVLILAHLVVLAVGGTAAIQAIRLEYFEFFEKFYEGGGKKYNPFGQERMRSTDN